MNEDQRKSKENHVIIVGGGFTGMTAAYELARCGIRVTVLEAEDYIGGLAGSFMIGETPVERFYHHCFVNDSYVMGLVEELGLKNHVIKHPTTTGMYYENNLYKLSTPFDLLRFKPLSLPNRIKLGLLVLKARRYKNWQELDDITASEWLTSLAGKEVFRVAWEPLLIGKFGDYASKISAAWFWAKLALRGGSRGKKGEEQLVYFRGGFAKIIDHMVQFITSNGGDIHYSTSAIGLDVKDGQITGLTTRESILPCNAVIATTALPIVADLIKPHVSDEFVKSLLRVEYLANVCLVLQLDRSLSEYYWLNVNDPSFPFVGIIEHTNLEPPVFYSGNHIVYLSKYLPSNSKMYNMSDDKLLSIARSNLQHIFPEFDSTWIKSYRVWRAKYAQPLVTCGYRHIIPDYTTPIDGFYIANMAQVYPEDRGVNYAVREGQIIAKNTQEFFTSEEL